MKILKKLFLIGLFSFVFLLNDVKAAAQYNFTSNSYNTAVDNYLTYNSDKTFNDFVELLNPFIDDLQNEIGDNNYIIYFDNYPSSSYPQYFRLYYVYGDFHLATYLNNSKGGFRFYKDSSLKWNYKDIRFNSNYTELSLSSSSTTTDSSFLNFASSNTIWSVVLYSNMDSIKYTQYSWSDFSFSINNIGEYTLPSDVPLSSFINTKYNFEIYDYFNPPIENPNKCISYDIGGQIGEVRNVKNISFRVHDTSNALDFPIEGYFRLVSPQFNDVLIPIEDYIDVSVSPASTNEGEYSFKYNISWQNESGDTIDDLLSPRWAIYFDYDLIAEDDIDTYLDIIITLSIKDTIPAGNVTFFDNPVQIYANIYNCDFSLISYGYKDNNNIVYGNNDSVLTNFLQNMSLPDLGMFNNINGLLPEGPVDSILTLPLSVLNSLQTSLGQQCSNLRVTLPFVNSDITLPCIRSFYDSTGFLSFFELTGTIASVIILLQYFTFLYNWLDNVMRLGNSQLETWGAEEEFSHALMKNNGEVR